MPIRHAVRRRTILFGGTAVAVAVLVTAPPASAASNYIATPNGMTGVSQTITINAPSQKGSKVSIKVVDGAKKSATFHTTVNSHGFGSLTWTPTAAGPATLTGVGSISSIPAATVQVAASPSYLELRAPDLVQANTAFAAIVDVYVPMGAPYGAGNAQLATFGAGPGSSVVLASAPMQDATSSRPTATITYTLTQPQGTDPANPIGTSLFAMFQGTSSSPSGAAPVPSYTLGVNASAGPVPVAIRSEIGGFSGSKLPANAPAAIDAVLGPGYPDGTVVWSVDGAPVTGPLPTSGGVAAWGWTPTTTGAHTLSVTYSAVAADGVTPVSGSDSLSVTVADLQVVDAITVTPKGGSAWKTGTTVKMKKGSSVGLTAKSTSGTPVLLSETGPCVLKGATLMAINSGTCKVTAVSPGTLKYTPGKAVYTVSVTS